MTEAEWLNAGDSKTLLDYFCERPAWVRKLRLFTASCCRRRLTQPCDPRIERAIEVAERMCDEKLSSAEHLDACRDAEAATEETWVVRLNASQLETERPAEFERVLFAFRLAELAETNLGDTFEAATEARWLEWRREQRTEPAHLVPLVREIFGNPFRPARIDQAWLAWHDGTILKLAQAAYEERELPSGHLEAARLAIVADALEEAGCTDADILGHLRGPGPHVRGCWVIDSLLGKE